MIYGIDTAQGTLHTASIETVVRHIEDGGVLRVVKHRDSPGHPGRASKSGVVVYDGVTWSHLSAAERKVVG